MSSWQIVLLEPARTVLAQISQFMVNALLVIIILLIGWLLSKVRLMNSLAVLNWISC